MLRAPILSAASADWPDLQLARFVNDKRGAACSLHHPQNHEFPFVADGNEFAVTGLMAWVQTTSPGNRRKLQGRVRSRVISR